MRGWRLGHQRLRGLGALLARLRDSWSQWGLGAGWPQWLEALAARGCVGRDVQRRGLHGARTLASWRRHGKEEGREKRESLGGGLPGGEGGKGGGVRMGQMGRFGRFRLGFVLFSFFSFL
jgi:hypothetical protein